MATNPLGKNVRSADSAPAFNAESMRAQAEAAALDKAAGLSKASAAIKNDALASIEANITHAAERGEMSARCSVSVPAAFNKYPPGDRMERRRDDVDNARKAVAHELTGRGFVVNESGGVFNDMNGSAHLSFNVSW